MTQTIKKLAALELVLLVAVGIAIFVADSYLPSELQAYLSSTYNEEYISSYLIFAIIWAVVVFVFLASLVGLLFTKLWARNWFIYSTAVMFPACFFLGPNVDHAVSYTLDQIAVLVQGMLLSLLLFNSSYQESALNQSSKGTQ